MSDMKAYLAAKYMSGPKADAILARSAPKKKKRKHATDASTSASTSFLKDDDGGWGDDPNAMAVDEDNDVHEAVVASDRGFKKRKVNTGWQTVQKPLEEEDMPDEKPQVVEEETEKPFAGGLVSASRLKKVLPGSAPAAPTITAEEEALAQETVYRDASGRKIDTKAAKAEAARKKREKDEKEAEKMEWGKGLVQREEKERIRQEMLKNRSKGFARHADDEDLNEEQKQKELWNDPAAAFLSSSSKKSKGLRKPQYVGPTPAPNRYNIKPGYRWDGVDRGNGFEAKFFQSQNARKRLGQESHQWSVEDM